MDPYLTVYRKDYVSKPLTVKKVPGRSQEFRDPLNNGFVKYLRFSDGTLPKPEEEVNVFFQRLMEKEPKTVDRYFASPVNKEIIERSFIFDGRTMYQLDYCSLVKDLAYKEELKRKTQVTLPDDWDIPLTTQKKSYRNPTMLDKNALKRVPPIKARGTLGPDEQLRKIMKVNTGYSEYQGVIGDLGDIIIEDQMHGEIIHLPCKKEKRR